MSEGILRASDFGPEGSDEGEALDASALAWLAAKALEREQRAALTPDARGRVRCPVCVGSGDGVEFLSACGACSGTGRVTPADAAEIRSAA